MFTLTEGTISRVSDSDYGTLYTSDEDCIHSDGERHSTCSSPSSQPGTCPNCKKIFDQPLTLQCGHSLCALCCQQLLDKMVSTGNVRRTRIRMGVSSVSYSRLDKNASHMRSNSSVRSMGTLWKSPVCPVCGERAKTTPPVPNLELASFLKSYQNLKLSEYDNPAYRTPYERKYRRKSDSVNIDTFEEDTNYRIRECYIAVVGARGVGKTSLTRVQYGNDMIFGDVLGKKTVRNEESLNSTFMIDILDDQDLDSNIDKAHGFVLVYSVTDRDSFFRASEIYQTIMQRREIKPPMVLVGSKCDSMKKRRVESYEGQGLARHIGCPFLEVSAKKNECVNEAFVELMRVVEKKKLLQ